MERPGSAVVAVAVTLLCAGPAQAAADPERRLFVFGDSFSIGTGRHLPDALPRWRVKLDGENNRKAKDAAPALRERGPRLAPVIHLSLGTVDHPRRTKRFRRAVRRAMRAAGPARCVVWTNIWRPSRRGGNGWWRLNRVLDDEAGERHNLLIVDWASMVMKHPQWLHTWDATHPTNYGYRRRAGAVADAARECRARLRPESE